MQENNWVITPKKGKGKLPLLSGNGERVISHLWGGGGGGFTPIIPKDKKAYEEVNDVNWGTYREPTNFRWMREK